MRYGNEINNVEKLNATLTQIEHYLHSISSSMTGEELKKKKLAAQVFTMLTPTRTPYRDEVSQVTLPQLIALFWIAISDNTQCPAHLHQEGLNQLVQALYEIAQEYILDENGVALKSTVDLNNRSCPSGGFNKLIEKLIALHPDATIEFTTPEVASMKLPALVRETAFNFLFELKTSGQLEEYEHHIQNLSSFENNELYALIQDKIKETYLDIFHSLYPLKENDPTFKSINENGVHTDLSNLSDAIENKLKKLQTDKAVESNQDNKENIDPIANVLRREPMFTFFAPKIGRLPTLAEQRDRLARLKTSIQQRLCTVLHSDAVTSLLPLSGILKHAHDLANEDIYNIDHWRKLAKALQCPELRKSNLNRSDLSVVILNLTAHLKALNHTSELKRKRESHEGDRPTLKWHM